MLRSVSRKLKMISRISNRMVGIASTKRQKTGSNATTAVTMRPRVKRRMIDAPRPTGIPNRHRASSTGAAMMPVTTASVIGAAMSPA